VVDTLILDLLDPEEARRPPMGMKGYSDEFKADAVALFEFESPPGRRTRASPPIWASPGLLCASGCRVTANAAAGARRLAAARDTRTPAQVLQAVPSSDPEERIRHLGVRIAELKAGNH
jgi:transposase